MISFDHLDEATRGRYEAAFDAFCLDKNSLLLAAESNQLEAVCFTRWRILQEIRLLTDGPSYMDWQDVEFLQLYKSMLDELDEEFF